MLVFAKPKWEAGFGVLLFATDSAEEALDSNKAPSR